MSLSRRCRRVLRLCLPSALFLVCASNVQPKQLPIKTYTLADGLAHDRVKRIVRDSRGFLWFCTADGISRFDGYQFLTFDSRQDLPNPSTNDLLETRAGVYWIATNGAGIARLDPSPDTSVQGRSRVTPVTAGDQNQSLFKIYTVGDQASTNRVNVLFEDRQGRIWAGTDGGLFQMDPSSGGETFAPVDLNLADGSDFRGNIWEIEEDQQQNLWFATTRGLWFRRPDGRIVQYGAPAVINQNIHALSIDREGRIWAGYQGGVLVFKPDQTSGKVTEQNARWQEITWSQRSHEDTRVRLPEAPGEALRYTTAEGLPSAVVHAIYQADDGVMWIGTASGLAEFDGGRFSTYTGLPKVNDSTLISFAEDRDGNLWIGTYSNGALKLARNGLTSFGKSDGLEGDITQIDHIFETPEGELGIITDDARLYDFDGMRFTPIQPRLAAGAGGINHVMQDRAGDYWISTTSGLYQFPPVRYLRDLARTAPKAVYTASTESNSNNIRFAFEDSRGDIWIGTNGRGLISRWERSTGTIHRYQESDGVPRGRTIDITEDQGGTIWFSVREGGLVRYRDGHFRRFTAAQVPDGYDILGLFPDHAGRLWLAINSVGLVRIDQTEAEQPRITTYTIAQGLSSNGVRQVTENQLGQIYVATARGIDRLDPATGHVKHYSTADGLAGNETITAYRGRQGILWFGSSLGLSRLEPASERKDPPPVFISGLQVSGIPYRLSPLGETRIEGLVFEPGQRQFQLSFFALGESLRYQYFIEGLSQNWSVPTEQRTLTLNLAPGGYRISLRAVSGDGGLSSVPATISFTILRPVWQRWWFIGLGTLLMATLLFAFYRYRMARLQEVNMVLVEAKLAEERLRKSKEERLRELELVRERIASDLHDDIGSSLTQISLLSEVVNQRIDGSNEGVRRPLMMIANSSRELIDAMSDIVWAINPQKDHVSDLSQRMRSLISELSTFSSIRFNFRTLPLETDLPLGANLRREIFLIFKESVNNIVKHSGATKAEMEFRVEKNQLFLRLRDNGRGFDLNEESDGHGLISMRTRAEAFGGKLELVSVPDQGTTVTLQASLEEQSMRVL